MKDLWRKATELFWKYPILWLPLICAELSAFCLDRLDGFITKKIFDWFLGGRSLFSNDPLGPPLDGIAVWKATAASLPSRWAIYYLNLLLFSVAFVLTVRFVEMLLEHQRPDVPASLIALRSDMRRILLFPLAIMALLAIISGLMYLPVTYLWPYLMRQSRLAGTAFPFAEALLVSACIAWVMTPWGIKLIQRSHKPRYSEELVRSGRILTVLGVLVINALWYLILRGENAMILASTPVRRPLYLLIHAIGSTLAVFPCVLLFVSLSLLVLETDGKAGEETDSHSFALPPDAPPG